jgi:hypothetical protein
MTVHGSREHFQQVVSAHVVSLHGTCRCGTYVGTGTADYRRHIEKVWAPHTLPDGWLGEEARTIHSVTIPGHGLFRAYADDVEDIYDRYSDHHAPFHARLNMLHDANEIATPVDFSDVSTSALAVILASFTPGSSAL